MEGSHELAVEYPAEVMMARTSALVSTSAFCASIVASLHVPPRLVQWDVQLVSTLAMDHAPSAGTARSSGSRTAACVATDDFFLRAAGCSRR